LKNWKAWTIGTVSGLLGLYSIDLLYEGFISDHYSGLLTYPFVDRPAAERAYDRLPENAPITERALAARRLVDADPANPESWNAVAYTDWLAHGGLSPAGVQALDHSYAVSFFDRPQAVWRVTFATENWATLTPEIRQDVIAEAKVALHDPTLGPQLRAQLKSISGPTAQMAAALILAINAT
jgi:hypothetical protein